MPETWPPTIPTDILRNGFSQQARPDTIRSTVTAGIDKLRRRYTTPVVNSTCSMILTFDQYTDLETFYNLTLQGGVLSFNFTDPADNVEYEYRMKTPPKYGPYGGINYTVSMEWERV